MTDSVVIEIPAETMDIAAIFTKSFFDKLGLETDVVCVKCPVEKPGEEDEKHSGQEGGERPKELTMPYRLFYNIFSIFSLPFSSQSNNTKDTVDKPAVAAAPPKPPVSKEISKPENTKPAESTVSDIKQEKDTKSFSEFLKNTIVSNPTKVEENAPSLYNIGKETVVSIVKPVASLNPVDLSDTKKEEPKEPVSKTMESTVAMPIFDNQKESIKEFVSVWPSNTSDQASTPTPVLRIELFGKEIKRVESKTEYSHYMDEYLLKREIDIISNGRKKMVSTQYCEQYIVDGRYVILGAIEDKPQEDLKPEIQWNIIKNTEAYKKFVRYNII